MINIKHRRSVLNWQSVHATMPLAKMLASGVGWLNSAATNVMSSVQMVATIYSVQNPARPDMPTSTFLLAVGIGLFLFLFLTCGQIYALGANHHAAYLGFLIPDVAMTAWQWQAAILYPLLLVQFGQRIETTLGAWALGIGIGVLSAKLPEWLTFGAVSEPKHLMMQRPMTTRQGGE